MTPGERLAAHDAFEDDEFEGIELERADLGDKTFYRCTFRGARLPESRWAGARLEDCAFEACDLTRMVPKRLAALGVTFTGCKLLGTAWEELSLYPQLTFRDCDLRYASFVRLNLRKTALTGSGLREASFLEVDLGEADFSGSDLTGALFERCDLRKANLSQARGALVDPAKNRAKDARISWESAALLATSLGLRVSDAGGDDERPKRPGKSKKG
jgi:uncharacterized protein YjbI with pentapeptide repeats